MVLPTVGNQVNVPDPEPLAGDEEDDDELCGIATVQVPASPRVAFTTLWLVSDRRVTVAVDVR
jgi:hypothetical protein